MKLKVVFSLNFQGVFPLVSHLKMQVEDNVFLSPLCTWKEWAFFYCWVECSGNVRSSCGDSVIQAFLKKEASLVIFSLVVLSLFENMILKSPTTIAELFVSPFICHFLLLYSEIWLLYAYMFIIVLLPVNWSVYHYKMSLLSLVGFFLKVYFVW